MIRISGGKTLSTCAHAKSYITIVDSYYPKNPDPSKLAISRTPKHPCYIGSNPSIGGFKDLRVEGFFLRESQVQGFDAVFFL